MDRIPYTYLVKFKPTNQVYYGSRTAKGCNPNEFFNFSIKKPYTTSSRVINELLEIFGIESFEWQIRKVFSNKVECLKWEYKVLNYFNVENNPKFLNGDSKQKSWKPIHIEHETKFIYHLESKICIRVHRDSLIPDGWSLGNYKMKGRDSTIKNKMWIYNISTGQSKTIFKDEKLPDGWSLGRNPETILKQKTSLKSRNLIYITDGQNSLLIPKGSSLPEGYYPGRTFTNKPSGKRMQNYIWITDGLENKQIPENSTLSLNWRLGRTLNVQNENNPSAKRVKYNGVIYPCLKIAIEKTGKSRYLLLKSGLE